MNFVVMPKYGHLYVRFGSTNNVKIVELKIYNSYLGLNLESSICVCKFSDSICHRLHTNKIQAALG